jgi:hypothetical protein
MTFETFSLSTGLLWTLLSIGGVFVIGLIAVLVLRRLLRRKSQVDQLHAFAHLRVSLPKEAPEQHQQMRDWREQLASYETLFITLGGVHYRPGGGKLGEAWFEFWYGRHDHIAFEMVAVNGQIFFYVVAPRALRQLLELQILAQYPKAQIEEVEDYNIFAPNACVQGTSLKLTKSSMYPIRTYRKLDSDPLNAIAMALGKVQAGEGAVVQLSIRPKRRGWERLALKRAKAMHEQGSTKRSVHDSGLGFLTSSFQTSDPYKQQRVTGPTMLTPQEQETIKSLEEKAGKPGFEANIRIVTSSPNERNARVHLENIANAFTQYQAPESGTTFKRGPVRKGGKIIWDTIWRNFTTTTLVLNSEEVNSIYHFPLPTMDTPNIAWLAAQQAAAPVALPTEGLVLGHNMYRGQDLVVKMKSVDRRRHLYAVGTTGTGKSIFLANMAIQDIADGKGVCVVDPHGDLIQDVLEHIPANRMHDVIMFNPADLDRPMGLNMLEARTPQERDAAAQEMVAIFMKLFPPEMIGPMFEHNMRNAMLTLMEDEEHPGTIADIPRLFTDKTFQQYKVSKVKDPVVRAFWEKEMAKTSDFHKSEMLGYLISKVGRFVENAMMRNIIGQPKSAFNFRKVMDEKKILLVNLSKGQVGEVNAFLLGLIIVSKLQMAALSRADIPEDQRTDFYLYIDEFQNFITDSIATILSEARKYKLNLTMAHQYMSQLAQNNDTKVRDAILGNVGTMVAFRIGVEDAEILEKQFAPRFSAYDLVNQKKYTAYVRLLIDNTAAAPFHMETYPLTPGHAEMAQAILSYSRLRYGKDRATVEAEILERTQLGSPTTVPTAPVTEASR